MNGYNLWAMRGTDLPEGAGTAYNVQNMHDMGGIALKSNVKLLSGIFSMRRVAEWLTAKRNLKRRRGFTLVEIMVVVVIIGLLAALIGPRVIGQSESARAEATRVQISQLTQALELYHLDNGFFPTTDQGLQALIEAATSEPEPKNFANGGYLQKKQLPRDGWDNEFLYICPGENGDFDIISYGSDGREGGEDFAADIGSW